VRDHYAWTLAAAAWALNLATVWLRHPPAQPCRVLATATVSTTVWALLRHYTGRPALRPGEVVVTDDDFRHARDVADDTRAQMEDDGGRHLAPVPSTG
jgi:hypothetical protein